MNIKITSFNHDSRYRGCILSIDGENQFCGSVGVYTTDLRNCLKWLDDYVVNKLDDVTPENLTIVKSDVE